MSVEMTQEELTRLALTVRCPRCRAKAKSSCLRLDGVTVRELPHLTREDAALILRGLPT